MIPPKENGHEISQWIILSKNIEKYQTPSLGKSIWQIVNTFIPHIGLGS